jgi:hypothetical protein
VLPLQKVGDVKNHLHTMTALPCRAVLQNLQDSISAGFEAEEGHLASCAPPGAMPASTGSRTIAEKSYRPAVQMVKCCSGKMPYHEGGNIVRFRVAASA